MITVRVRDRDIYPLPLWPITTSSVGIPVAFNFDAVWDGLTKIAVFRGSGVDVEVALLTDAAVVPPEVLTTAGGDLYIGVYGRSAYGDLVIPTIWGKAGHIYDGTVPADPDPADPTPEWSYQVQTAASEALRIAQGLAAAAAAGDFDGADGQDGYSPNVTIADISGGHSVTITDVTHTSGQTFNVMDGERGDDGDAATVTVGTTTTGAAGTNASVTNSGTSSAAVFDFTIPKGDKGDPGIYFGTTEPTDPNVTVWIDPSGTTENYIPAPSSPTTGQFLKWSGSAWVASDLPVYSGGVS